MAAQSQQHPAGVTYYVHPTAIPIRYRFAHQTTEPETSQPFGLCFHCGAALPEGTSLEVMVEVCDEVQCFHGCVDWSRRDGDTWQVGLGLTNQDDVFRARMVEQLCHIEAWRQQVSAEEHRELTPENAALEWIEHFSSDFPCIQVGKARD
ncbi:MAG: hypothetical protein BMS9Abin15_0101 [Gammaproteobacteria bacterium]|nr:MAG: hypothetical protein BMS9Abin15_0101 [Gammaproteobacteria bacterium]